MSNKPSNKVKTEAPVRDQKVILNIILGDFDSFKNKMLFFKKLNQFRFSFRLNFGLIWLKE